MQHSDFAFAVSCEEALRAAFRCTFPSNCYLQLFDSGIFVHTAPGRVGRESGRRFTHTEGLLRQRLPAEADADAEHTQRQTTSRESQCKCSALHIYVTGEYPGKMSRRLTRTFRLNSNTNQTSSNSRVHAVVDGQAWWARDTPVRLRKRCSREETHMHCVLSTQSCQNTSSDGTGTGSLRIQH